jgi:hypothetical protein
MWMSNIQGAKIGVFSDECGVMRFLVTPKVCSPIDDPQSIYFRKKILFQTISGFKNQDM